MIFAWNEKKRQRNIRKHGIDFAGSEPLFEGRTLTVEDDRLDYGERRFITIGLLAGRCVSVVHTETGKTIRIISIRKATKYEQAEYFKDFPSEDD